MDAYIKALSYTLPAHILKNEQLVEEFPEWSVDKIALKVGVHQRHVAGDDETSGDIATQAAKKLFQEWEITPNDIDFILLCTQSPDYFLPTTACILQERLGIPISAGALDYNLGCSGYVYGLALAKGLVVSGVAKNILLLTAETYTKFMHPKDKGNRTIFGDGASATIVSDTGFARIGEFAFGTDGRGADNLMVKAGGSKYPQPLNDEITDVNGAQKYSDYLYMNGAEIFSFTQKMVPLVVEQVLENNSIESADVTLHIFHQANKFMLDFLRKKLKIKKERFYIDLETTGNTVSSTIPIALAGAIKAKKLIRGNRAMLVGFGVGYSWGGVTIDFV